MSLLTLKSINKYYGAGEGRQHILKDISLTIERGEFVAIMGQSGSGKSTLMNILGCLDTPSAGSYTVNGKETGDMDADQLSRLRRDTFGFIFQRYHLLNLLSAGANVALPGIYAGQPKATRESRAKGLMAQLKLEEKFASLPNELSGGQQQRVSIARALMNGGEVILADEPTGALDSQSGTAVMEVLESLNKQGHTIVLVTHDASIAAYASRVLEIKDGEIVSDKAQKHQGQNEGPTYTNISLNSKSFDRYQLAEAFLMSVQAIKAHKLRSLLTMLGVIIGVASVVVVVALGMGSQKRIIEDIQSMGTNTITIFPGEGFGDRYSWRIKTLTAHDAIALAKQQYVDSAAPEINSAGVILHGNISGNAQLQGVGEQYFLVRGIQLESGRFFNSADINESASVAVLNHETKNQIFPDGNAVGKIIFFGRKPLVVIGVARPFNSMLSPSGDLGIWTPYSTAMFKIIGSQDINSISVKIKDGVNVQLAEKGITDFLATRHGGKKDFFTFNADSIKQTVEKATNTLTILISGIAFISLVVGGIGVMNIMLVSVTERTPEIGIRMALGASRNSILAQFLIEAVLLCLVGGGIGVGIAFITGFGIELLVENFPLSYSIEALCLAVLCSISIGVFFGFVPAKNASRLNPIVALARE